VPPHWNEGVKEDHGSRWAGQVTKCLSTVYFCLFTAVFLGRSLRAIACTAGESTTLS
jgi:hypothetical protein